MTENPSVTVTEASGRALLHGGPSSSRLTGLYKPHIIIPTVAIPAGTVSSSKRGPVAKTPALEVQPLTGSQLINLNLMRTNK